jgi:tetratricopeptide (TPR) repeat protein
VCATGNGTIRSHHDKANDQQYGEGGANDEWNRVQVPGKFGVLNSESVMHVKYTILVSIAAVMLSSCANPVVSKSVADKEAITAEMVLQASPLARDIEVEDFAPVDILALSPEMIAFLDEHVDRRRNRHKRLTQLVDAVIGGGRFQLVYDDSTGTAKDTFLKRRGNCLSFTNMFVAMARNLGLPASYQEIEIPPNWAMVGRTFLLSQHVNVLVDFKNDNRHFIDFNIYDLDVSYPRRVISDQRALAHYYNNIGVEHMLADETLVAFMNFRKSIQADQTFGSAWVNLGNLHRRENYLGYAETVYLEALKFDKNNLMAMSNLANLYEEVGKSDLAEEFRARVRKHRLNNPYYRYQLANSAFNEGDYETAISNLKYAIRQRKDEDRFYFLMSLSYLMNGKKEDAQKWMKKAEDVARESESKKKYQHKLDLLRSMSTQGQL